MQSGRPGRIWNLAGNCDEPIRQAELCPAHLPGPRPDPPMMGLRAYVCTKSLRRNEIVCFCLDDIGAAVQESCVIAN